MLPFSKWMHFTLLHIEELYYAFQTVTMQFLFLLFFVSIFKINCTLNIGAISYWNQAAEYDSLPGDGIAIINPYNGIIDADPSAINEYKEIFGNLKNTKPNLQVVGYVPTGYGDRKPQPYAKIQAQVHAYYGNFSDLDGIFFDEIGNTCENAELDFPKFRSFVLRSKPTLVIFNPGWVGDNFCYLNYSNRGEVVMSFENSYADYLTDTVENDLSRAKSIAKDLGVLTWHVIHSTSSSQNDLTNCIDKAKARGTDYIYVTDLSGPNPYLHPPSYWSNEKSLVT